MIVGVNQNGEVNEGNLKPSVDTVHHLFLYRNVKKTGGVCHTHSKFITVFSIVNIPVPVLTTAQADVFGKEIPVSCYVDNQGNNIGVELQRNYRNNGCPAVIMGNHGLFAFGESPQKAAFYALMAEYCAEVAYYAFMLGSTAGKDITPLPEEEIQKWYDRYHSNRYGQEK
jgi:L-ribulose-5-phosphate 4-epimerase